MAEPRRASFPIRLLWVNGVFNLLGAVLIVLASGRVGPMLGVGPEAEFLWSIIAACSFGFAIHSFIAARSGQRDVVRAAVLTMLTFHLATAGTAGLALVGGKNTFIVVNFGVHLMFSALFASQLRASR